MPCAQEFYKHNKNVNLDPDFTKESSQVYYHAYWTLARF